MARARFVSRYGNYSVGVQEASAERLGHDGKMIPAKRRLDANFQNRLVTDADLAVAVATFSFRGLPEDTDTNEHISPIWRVSVWDSEQARLTDGLTDDEIEQCIEALRRDPGYGQDHVEIAPAKIDAPLPNYDKLSVEEILEVSKLLHVSHEDIAAYERENANREALLKRLEGVDADAGVVVNAG